MRIIHPRWYRPTPLAHGLNGPITKQIQNITGLSIGHRDGHRVLCRTIPQNCGASGDLEPTVTTVLDSIDVHEALNHFVLWLKNSVMLVLVTSCLQLTTAKHSTCGTWSAMSHHVICSRTLFQWSRGLWTHFHISKPHTKVLLMTSKQVFTVPCFRRHTTATMLRLMSWPSEELWSTHPLIIHQLTCLITHSNQNLPSLPSSGQMGWQPDWRHLNTSSPEIQISSPRQWHRK